MPIQQTLVGLERAFAGRATVLSRRISADDTLDDNDGTWLQLRAPFPLELIRVYNRLPGERRIPNEAIETVVQRELMDQLPDNVRLTRDVAVGALYRDDLPVTNPVYANQYVVVSFEGIVDLERPILQADAHVLVELYFGLVARDRTWRIADTWYHYTNVENVGLVRKNAVKRRITALLTTNTGSGAPGEQIRDGLRAVFNQDSVRNWYVIPGTGEHNSDDNDVVVRHDASFYFVP